MILNSKKNNSLKFILCIVLSIFVCGSSLMFGDTASAASSGKEGFSKKPSTKASRLIRTAKSKTGRPYSWGSAGPNRFDCSGFVHWCVKKNGISLVRGTAGSYRKKGYNIGRNIKKARKGDIVIYGNGVHCALYAGHKKVIHATCRYGIKTTAYNYTAQPITDIIRTYTPSGNLKIKQKGKARKGWKYKITGRKYNGKRFAKVLTTDSKGYAKLGNIKKGNVHIRNIGTPKGYNRNKSKDMTIKHATKADSYTSTVMPATKD